MPTRQPTDTATTMAMRRMRISCLPMDGVLSLRKPPDRLKGRAYSLAPAPRKGRYSLRHRLRPQLEICDQTPRRAPGVRTKWLDYMGELTVERVRVLEN